MIGWYQAFLLMGGALSLSLFLRMARRDRAMVWIFLGGFIGAFAGAKLAFFAVEGWSVWGGPNRWMGLATGKSILGALPGGYAGVEIAKYMVGYTKPTGDYFAMVVPLGIALGRIGCLLHGCCPGRVCGPAWYAVADAQGILRWPAVPVEIVFNLAMAGVLLILRRTGKLPGQLFHVYLMSYGLFRLAHESLRDTPRIADMFSGYSLVAVGVFALGMAGFIRRRAAS